MVSVLSCAGLSLTYRAGQKLLARGRDVVALDNVTIAVGRGECVGLIGESGSGKSSLARVLIGLVAADTGQVVLEDHALPQSPKLRRREDRRRIQMVFQDPFGSLDPTKSLVASVREGLDIHGIGDPGGRSARARAVLQEVGLGPEYGDRRPHALSGGQRQRVAIARALAVEPSVIILDEPTSALDLSVQAHILNLLLRLQAERDLSYLLISHDVDVVRHMAHRTYVMKAGRILEHGPSDAVLQTPEHPYTRALLDAVPTMPGAA